MSERRPYIISILLRHWDGFYGPKYGLWMFHVSLRRMCKQLLLEEGFYRCIRYSWLEMLYSSTSLFLILSGRSVQSDRAVKSPTIIVCSSISPCTFINSCLVYYNTLLWRHIHIKDYCVFLEYWPFHHYVISLFTLGLNSALSEFNILTPTSFNQC